MEIEWKGAGVFAHMGAVQDWTRVVEHASVAAIRRLQEIDFGEWTAVYEIDHVRGPDLDRRHLAQYLVAEPHPVRARLAEK
jgi:hypothetical protein